MTTIENPGSDRVQAIFLKVHLGLQAKGMTHSKVSGKTLLSKASAITGIKYKRGQYEQARADLITWMDKYDLEAQQVTK